MPTPFYSFNDSRTGKDYKMPWPDVTKKPTDDDFYNFVNQENNKSPWAKLNTPLSDIPSTIARKIGEPLYRYGEYGDMEGKPKPEGGYKRSILRSLASGAGGWLESMGNTGDYMTSPIGAVSTFGGGVAGGVGKLGLPLAAKGIGYATQGVGALQAAHGAGGMYDAYNAGDWQGAAQAGLEMVTGGLGARYGGYKAKPKVSINPGYLEGEFTGPWAKGEIMEEGLARRPAAGGMARAGTMDSPYAPKFRQPQIPEINVGPRELPPMPGEGGLPPMRQGNVGPQQPQGPYYSGRRGVSPDLGSVTETSPRAQTPAQDAFYNQIPDRYKPLLSESISSEGLRGQAPFDYVPEAASSETAYSQGTKGYGPLPPKQMNRLNNQFFKKPTVTAAEKAAEDMKVGNQPMTTKMWNTLRDLYHDESGSVDLNEIFPNMEESLKGVTTNAKDIMDKINAKVKTPLQAAAKKFGGSELAADMSEMTLKSARQSGWGYLEEAGKPGADLERLLSKSRLDIDREFAQSTMATKKDPGRVGKEVWKRHGEEIDKLIAKVEDPVLRDKVESIVYKQLGRTQNPESAFGTGVNAIKKFQAATKLSHFLITNLGSLPANFSRGNTKAMIKATMDTMMDYKNSIETARKSGALGPLESEIMRDIGKSGDKGTHLINKFYGIDKSEEAMRTISALGGRATARELFDQLKANPGHKRARIRLDDLVLEDVDKVMKQSELTPQQLDRASARMAEITQGRAESIDLPPMWTGNHIADLVTQFKRYGFAQTRNMKEAFKKDPWRTSAAIMTAFPLIGEIVGDTTATAGGAVKGAYKTGMSGRWSGDDVKKEVWEALKGRGSGLERYGNDLSQSWAFGMLLDAMKAAHRGGSGLIEYMGGPTGADISHGGSAIDKAITKQDFKPLAREAAGKVPYIGTALANQIKTVEGRTSSGRSSRGRSRGGRSNRER